MSRLVVMCVDSLFTSDIEEIRSLKGFSTILEKAAVFEHIKCIYPTLTYPCHASIITGCMPDKHGITHNEILSPENNNANWYWDYNAIKVDTIFDHLKRANKTIAAVQWPVSANAPIDYLIPEIWSLQYQKDMSDILIDNGTESVAKIIKKHSQILDWKDNPQFDDFSVNCAVDIIHEYKPDVLFMHQSYLDHVRHVHGIHALEVKRALEYHDKWIQKIIEALKQEDIFDETEFIILGDHGQMDIDYDICPNVLLAQEGLINLDSNGNVNDWQCYIQSCGISAQVFVKDKAQINRVELLLASLKNQGYIRNIFTKEEVKTKYHLVGEFSYVIEAASNYAFSNNVQGDLLVETDSSDYKYSVATHGHIPERGDKPCFIVKSNKLPQGNYYGARLIDEMPTMMKLLGIAIDEEKIDGRALF